jgi:hypothetical protein
MAGAVQRTCSASAGAAGTARCRFAAVADAGACNHTLSQPHDFIRMAVHSQGPSVKGEAVRHFSIACTLQQIIV